jgi:hypothetical protein
MEIEEIPSPQKRYAFVEAPGGPDLEIYLILDSA